MGFQERDGLASPSTPPNRRRLHTVPENKGKMRKLDPKRRDDELVQTGNRGK
jgi:hypothetical protein